MPTPATPSANPQWRRLGCLAGLALLSGHASAQDAPDARDWTWHLRIAPVVALNIKADFKTTGPFTLGANQAGAAGVSGVNHIYDDGYVLVDQKGNAQGFTGYWGYNNAAQYNPAGSGTLTFHGSTAYNASGAARDSDSPYAGVEAAFGDDLWHWGRARLGWEAGVGLLPIKISDRQALAATVSQSVFTFDTAGIIVPTAPYNGGPSGVNEPTIHDTATAQPGVVVPGTVTGSRTLDVILYTLKLGPTFSYDVARKLNVQAGAGPAAGLVSGAYKFNEMIVTAGGTAINNGRINTTKFVYGGYANVLLTYRGTERSDVFAGAQFMPLSKMTVSGGGREARLDLSSALQFVAGVNFRF